MAYLSKPFVDMQISRKMNGQDIRDGIVHFHTQKSNPPNAPRPRPPNITAEKRLIGRCHDYLSLATFRAIERVYEGREKEEGLRGASQASDGGAQSSDEEAEVTVKDSWKLKGQGALLRQEQERDKLEETLKMQRTKQEQEVQLVRQKYLRFLVEKRRNMMEQETVKSFSRQHGALTKAFRNTTENTDSARLSMRGRRHISYQHAAGWLTDITGTPGEQVQNLTHLESRKQSKPTMSWIPINTLLFQKQQLSDKVKSSEVQAIMRWKSSRQTC
ncbi:hypothetical protein PHYPO_G00228280 [Pangasianodon hypophthalmus]|uniref:Uncharacterized protein n=1 Tax=Pangasianodon hypophthalmus TaxID=310915 RepID=A0A5N5NKE7_PANHP|nr:hypothetical protein PHYPO_G00228280 [Pangasianodon hypophthalmus]